MMTQFSVSDQKDGLGVPYPKGAHPDSTNVGYFDLKKHPEKISELPELRGWLELEKFLIVVNQPGSLFRTLRVDVAPSDINHSGFTKKITSYVTIAFEILEWNVTPGTYVDLYKRFCQFAAGYHTPDHTVVEFELISTSYNDHGINRGWSVDMWNTGLGTSEDEAREVWRLGLQVVQDYLVRENTLYAHQLKKGRKTIS